MFAKIYLARGTKTGLAIYFFQNVANVSSSRSVKFDGKCGDTNKVGDINVKEYVQSSSDHRSGADHRSVLFGNTIGKKEKMLAAISIIISDERREKDMPTRWIPLLCAGVCWGICILKMLSLPAGYFSNILSTVDKYGLTSGSGTRWNKCGLTHGSVTSLTVRIATRSNPGY